MTTVGVASALMFATALWSGSAHAQAQPSFGVCDSTMYLSIGGPTQLTSVDTSTNPFGFNPVGDPDSPGYNGIGFHPTNFYIYGSRWDSARSIHRLLRIGSDGSVREIADIIGGGINTDAAPAGGIDNYQQSIASGVVGPDGFLYLKHNHASTIMWRVNVTTGAATAINLNRGVSHGDIAWHNGLIYAHDLVNDILVTINPVTGVVSNVGTSGVPTAVFGSLISASNGIFGRDNNGGFYRFNTTTGEATLLSSSPTGAGDGAKCPTTAVTLPADLAIDKDDGRATYPPGGEVVYTITVTNNGPFGVQGATVTDPLPPGITTSSWTCSPSGGATCPAGPVGNANGNAIDGVLVNLPDQSSVTFTLALQVPLSFTGDLTNTATVSAPADSPDPTPGNNSDSDTDVADPVLTLAKSVTNDDGGTASVANFTLSASGPVTISGISGSAAVTDVAVPAGTYTLSETNQPGYTASPYSCVVDGGGPVSGNSLALANGERAVCTITNNDQRATLTLRKTIVNNDGGIAAATDFTLSAAGPANLSGPTGDPAVTNVSVPAGSYTLSETGPAGYTAGTYRCSVDGGAPRVGDTLALGSGQAAVCTITNDDIPPNVAKRKELVDESIADDFFPQDGELLTYEITLTNTGGTASNYQILDILDGNVTFVSASHGGTLVGSQVQWTLTVPAQSGATPGEVVLTVVTQVIDPLPPGEEVVNSVKTPVEPPPPCPSAQCVVIPPPPYVESEKNLVSENGSLAGVAEPGERLTYEITLRNLGSTTSDYDHRDLLDPNMVLVSADNGGVPTGGSPGGGQVDWTDLTVPGGTPSTPGTLVLTVVVDVVDPIPNGVSEIVNLSFDPTQPPPVCPSAQCVELPVPGIVDKDKALVGETGSINGVAEPGEQLTYEITLTNTGGPVTGYEIEDRMDANTVFVSASDGGAESGGVVTWTGLSIDAHDGTAPGVLVLTVTVEVIDPLPAGVTELTNIIAEPGETVDCVASPGQCVTTPAAPQISKRKELVGESGTLNDVAEPGETLTYRITVTNEGGADPAYEVQDLLDPNTTFTGATGGGQLMGGHVAWSLAVPAHDGTNPGTRAVEVTVRVDDPLPEGVTQLINIAREPGETIDCTITPTPPECVVTETGPNVSRNKELVDESGATSGVAEPGEELTYEITLTNTGGTEHPAYGLIDAYGDHVSVVSASNGGTDEGDWIRWSGLSVPPQVGATPGTLVLTVVTRVDDPLPAGVSRLRNVVKSGPTDPDPECPSAECVVIPAWPQISHLKQLVDESGPTAGVAEPGETLTYEITLTNRGGPTTDYAIYDVLDANTTFASADNGGVHDGSAAGGIVDWSGLAVPAQDNGTPGTLVLTVSVTVNDPLPEGTLAIVNIVKQDPGDPDPECPSDQCVVVEAQQPAIALVKGGAFEDTDGDGMANAGDTIVYTFTVTNEGNVALSDVVPEDQGPTFAGQAGESRLSGFTPSGVTLSPGGEQVFTATYVLGQTDIDNGAGIADGVENTATAIGYVNGNAVTGIEVESNPSLSVLALPAAASTVSITKVALLRFIRRGEEAPFAVTVTNAAGSLAQGLTIIDTLPSGFRYVDGSATIDGVSATPVVEGRRVIFENVDVAGLSEVEIRLRMLALSSAGPGEHVNRAHAEDASGNRVSNEARASVEILVEPVLDCGDIVGRVFDDENRNGYQDQGELGLPGVRIATVNGWLVTTDVHGRFNVPCAALPDQRIGSNFIMKVDTRTLPTGYRLTTENPRVARLTAGKMTELSFGASIGRVVRLDLQDAAFVPGEPELREQWAEGIDELIAFLAVEQSVLRLTYLDPGGDIELAEERLEHLAELIGDRWRQTSGQYRLDIEMRVETGQ